MGEPKSGGRRHLRRHLTEKKQQSKNTHIQSRIGRHGSSARLPAQLGPTCPGAMPRTSRSLQSARNRSLPEYAKTLPGGPVWPCIFPAASLQKRVQAYCCLATWLYLLQRESSRPFASRFPARRWRYPAASEPPPTSTEFSLKLGSIL